EVGLWIRKWKFTVFQKIMMHKMPAPAGEEKKFILIYFLNPAIFSLSNKTKNIRVNGPCNNMFFTSDVMMDFSVVPKQPFYVLDISFTASWLAKQISDADPSFKNIIDAYTKKNTQTILIEPSTVDEYRTLHELDGSMLADNENILFIRSRVYNLIVSFFSKVVNKKETPLIKSRLHYEQVMQAEMMIMENVKEPPKIEAIARNVNMSISSLLRQFKLLHGKSIHEYYIEKKMELAKKMILESKVSIKEIAKKLGYNQPSPFIETFTKQYGCSPGSLKLVSEQSYF
ncbi:MAG: AraC family transcriptional regulator, partial [Segetibacter sp.]